MAPAGTLRGQIAEAGPAVTVHNADIAATFEKVADLLEIEGANAFRVRAWRKAAQTIAALPRKLSDMVGAGEDLRELPGIGEDLAARIAEIVDTGKLALLEEIERRTPGDLAELMDLPGLGPKRVLALHETLGVTGIEDVLRAARTGALRKLPGFGPKLQEQILHALTTRGAGEKRMRLMVASAIADDLLGHLRTAPGIGEVAVAGSFRRRKETVGDLDLLASGSTPARIVDHFMTQEDIAAVVEKGGTRATVILRGGLQVDLRAVPAESFGATLQYLTGSKAHNVALRRLARADGLKLNEYGIFRNRDQLAGRTEEDVYAMLGLPWIPPELRENQGEIEAAREGRLPRLVTRADIRGDLHIHTRASDGSATLAGMAAAARALGYEYIAITEHSQRVTVAHGLDETRLAEQIDEIDALNATLKDLAILKGVEVDILEDGSLDLPDSILRRLDIVLGAVHSAFGLDRDAQTDRLLRAMDNPNLNLIAHPTGRLIGRRDAMEIDMPRLIDGAARRGVFLEINGQPDRLDLDDRHCHMAKLAGLRMALSTDAHRPSDLEFMAGAVDQARRGWIEAGDVLNTKPLGQLRKLLKR